jgi:hypothetical protein
LQFLNGFHHGLFAYSNNLLAHIPHHTFFVPLQLPVGSTPNCPHLCSAALFFCISTIFYAFISW